MIVSTAELLAILGAIYFAPHLHPVLGLSVAFLLSALAAILGVMR